MGTPNKLCLFENFERPQARGYDGTFGAPRWEPNDRKRVRSRRVGHSIARACDQSEGMRSNRRTPKGEAFLSNGTCNVEHIFYNQNSLAIQNL